MSQKSFNLSEKLLNSILGYLATRPYQEVFQLVNGISMELKSQVSPVEPVVEVVPDVQEAK